MTTETLVLDLTILLAFIQVIIQLLIMTGVYGLPALVGARDNLPASDNVYLGRMRRTNANMLESLPWALALLIMVQVAGVAGGATAFGAWLYLIARVVYLPMYVFGVPWLRTLSWLASIVGLAFLLVPLFG